MNIGQNFFRGIKVTEMDKRKRDAENRLTAARNFEEPDRVPVQIGVGGPFFCSVLGYTLYDFYRNLDLNLKIQFEGSRWAYENLGDDRTGYAQDMEQMSPNMGATQEGVIWDCDILLPTKDNPWRSPWIVPKFRTPDEIEKLEVPDPKECVKRAEKHYVKAFGVKPRGELLPPGIHAPFSAAGSLLGTDILYVYLYKYPDLMQRLFKKLLKSLYVLVDYVDDQRGETRTGIGLYDDHGGYLSEKMYRKFVLPYNKQIYERYGKEGRFLHMDSQTDHIAHILRDEYKLDSLDLGWQADIAKIKEVLDGRVFFKGNLNSSLLVASPYEEIERAVEHCIYSAAPGGGYVFDLGGETYAGVDVSRLKYAIEYAKKIGRYPIKDVSSDP
jgi:uroporphyrinogen-III decarboxylase